MEFLIIGIAVAFNCMIIKVKFERGRIADGALDATLLAILTVVFSGTYGALVVGTIASAFISIFLLINPPKIDGLEAEVRKFFEPKNKRKGPKCDSYNL